MEFQRHQYPRRDKQFADAEQRPVDAGGKLFCDRLESRLAASSSNAALTVYFRQHRPTIVSQTPNQVVLLGSTATFSVTVSGTVFL